MSRKPWVAGLRDVPGEVGGVGHQVADELAQAGPGRRHDQAGGERRRDPAEPQQGAVEPADEPCPAGQPAEGGELRGGDPVVLRPGHPVHEPQREVQAGGVGDQRGEPAGGSAFRLAAAVRGGGYPAVGQGQGGGDVVGEGGHPTMLRGPTRGCLARMRRGPCGTSATVRPWA